MDREKVSFNLDRELVETWVDPNQTLLEVLRASLGRTEVKYGCGEGVCGTCTVLLDGELINSCLMLAVQADGHEVVTPRGLRTDEPMQELQKAFLEAGAAQCGFCTPGLLLTAHHLLGENRQATRDEVRAGLSGNLCRCTGYTKILDGVELYQRMRSGAPEEAAP